MDKKTADELIAVLQEKIALLQSGCEEIRKMVDGGVTDADSTTDGSDEAYGRVSENTRKVHEVLLASGRSMSPKSLHTLLKEQGLEIDHNRMRQILHQNKKRLFVSRRRGLWKARPIDQ